MPQSDSPTADLVVEVDEQCPPWTVVVRVTPTGDLRVMVNPEPRAEVLAALRRDVGFAIADAVDGPREV